MALNVRVTNQRHNPEVEEFVRNRLDLVVGRFAQRLSTLDVHIRDENAQKGGVDKTCSIDAHLFPRGTVHVHATESDIQKAILKAVERLKTVVTKTVDRGHQSAAVRHGEGGTRHMEATIPEANDDL